MKFIIKQFIFKIIFLINMFLGLIIKPLFLIMKQIDISILSELKIWQVRNIKIGRYSIIRKGVILDANKKSIIELGDNVVIQENTYLLNYGGKGIVVGTNTNINKDCILYGHGGLQIGENCLIAAKCVFISANHNFLDKNKLIMKQGETRKGIKIGNNVWIGTGVTILDGVNIGNDVIIGAGSLVNKNIESNSIALGLPAKKIKNLY